MNRAENIISMAEAEKHIRKILETFINERMEYESLAIHNALDRIASEDISEQTRNTDKYSLSGYGTYVVKKSDMSVNNELIIRKGDVITPNNIAMLMNNKIDKVKVIKEPKFGIITPIEGSNIKKFVKSIGGEVIYPEFIYTNFNELQAVFDQALNGSDIIILTSNNKMNYTRTIINLYKDSRILHDGIYINSKESVIIGEVRGKLVVGLSGDIEQDRLVCEYLVSSFLDTWLYRKSDLFGVNAIIEDDLAKDYKDETIQLVELIRGNQVIVAKSIKDKITEATGYFVTTAMNKKKSPGDTVFVTLFSNKLLE